VGGVKMLPKLPNLNKLPPSPIDFEKVKSMLASKLTLPETRTEKKLLKDEVYFICSICRRELGPVSKTKLGKLFGLTCSSLNIVKGVINPMDPTSVVGIGIGIAGLGKTLFGDSSLNLFEIPKQTLEKRELGKNS
jgi:hypothetical protein